MFNHTGPGLEFKVDAKQRGRCLPKGRCGIPSNRRDSGSESQGGQYILRETMAVGTWRTNWAEAEEIAREKSERLRGNERGLGERQRSP